MATNLWENASLEANVDDWNGQDSGAIAHSSTQAWQETYSMRCTPAGGTYSGAVSIDKTVNGSTEYTISLYFYPTSGTINYRAMVRDQDDNLIGWLDTGSTFAVDEWTRVDATFTTGADDTAINILWSKNNQAGTDIFYIDGVMLETGSSASAWVDYDSGGAVSQVPAGALAIQGYNPVVGAANGLWEMGAYIYDVLNEIKVNPTLGTMVLQGHNPTVGATGAGVDVDATLGTWELAGLNPIVGATATTDSDTEMLILYLRRILRGSGHNRRMG